MTDQAVPAEQLITEETPKRLTLTRPNHLRLWGVLSLALAVITAVVTVNWGIGLGGWLVTLAYAGGGMLLVTSKRSVTIDRTDGVIFFSTHYLFFDHQTRLNRLSEIDKVYLDYEEEVDQDNFLPKEHINRTWFIFLVLKDHRTMTIAQHRAKYPVDKAPNLSRETYAWDGLAKKVSAATGKLLIRMPSVPSRTPRTFVDVIDQIVQRRLELLPESDPLRRQTIRLRSHPSGDLEIVVDGVTFGALGDIDDRQVRSLIEAAIDEWRGPDEDLRSYLFK